MSAVPPPMPNSVRPCDIETLRAELSMARGAQRTAETARQTAEIALANEREANIAKAVRRTINDAIRGQYQANSERDRARFHLEQSQRILRALKEQLVDTLLENQFLRRENKELTQPRSRYSPYPRHSTRHRGLSLPIPRHRAFAPTSGSPRAPTRRSTPPSPLLASPTSPLDTGSPDLPSYGGPTVPSLSGSFSPGGFGRI